MKTFAVLYLPGSAWQNGLPFAQQPGVMRHREFLSEQHRAGVLVFGGPFLDDAGGLSVFNAESVEDLRRILDRDATIAGGLLRYEIHPYLLAFIAPPQP